MVYYLNIQVTSLKKQTEPSKPDNQQKSPKTKVLRNGLSQKLRKRLKKWVLKLVPKKQRVVFERRNQKQEIEVIKNANNFFDS